MSQSELSRLTQEVLAEAREVDAQAATLRGKIRGFEEEVGKLTTSVEALDRHAALLKQKALSLHRAVIRQEEILTEANSTNLSVVPESA